MPVTAKHFSLV